MPDVWSIQRENIRNQEQEMRDLELVERILSQVDEMRVKDKPKEASEEEADFGDDDDEEFLEEDLSEAPLTQEQLFQISREYQRTRDEDDGP